MPEPDLDPYIESVALFFETSGLPRIAGRILGLLLVCDPPHRSSAELADAIGASRGSISTMTRMLHDSGLIERVAVPQERATYYRIDPTGFERRFEILMRTIVGFRPLADRGLDLLADASPERTRRLREIRALYVFLERSLPAMIDAWRAQRDALIDGAEDPP